jgi:hypothetical protein
MAVDWRRMLRQLVSLATRGLLLRVERSVLFASRRVVMFDGSDFLKKWGGTGG